MTTKPSESRGENPSQSKNPRDDGIQKGTTIPEHGEVRQSRHKSNHVTTESTPGTTNNEQQTRVERAKDNSPKPMQAPETRTIQEGTHQKRQLIIQDRVASKKTTMQHGTTRTQSERRTRRDEQNKHAGLTSRNKRHPMPDSPVLSTET